MEDVKAAKMALTKAAVSDGDPYRARPHPIALFAPGIMLAAAVILAYVAHRHAPGIGVRLGLRAESVGGFDAVYRWFLVIVPAIIGLNLLATAVACRTTTYAVSGDRVTATSGLLRRTTSTIFLAKVESTIRDQGPLERLIDSGTMTLVTAGGCRDTLTHVRNFSRFTAALERALARPET